MRRLVEPFGGERNVQRVAGKTLDTERRHFLDRRQGAARMRRLV